MIPWKGRKTLNEVERAILDSAPGARNDLRVLQEKAREVVLGPVGWPYRLGDGEAIR